MLRCRVFQWKQQGGVGVGRQLPALGAFEVGVEDEAGRIDVLEQHHANVGQPVRVGGGQRHGVGVVGLLRAGLLQPFGEEGERVVLGQQRRRLGGGHLADIVVLAGRGRDERVVGGLGHDALGHSA